MPASTVRAIENPEFGDYTSTLPFQLSKVWMMPPHEVGGLLTDELAEIAPKDYFKSIQVVKGFLNFALSDDAYTDELAEILAQKKKYGNSKAQKKRKIQIEFISGNPTGLLTLGNGRGAFLGDALAHALARAGHSVTREYYVNDAKASTQIRELGKTGLGIGTTYLTDHLKEKIAALKPKIDALKKKQPKNIEGEVGHLLARAVHEDNAEFIAKKLKVDFDLFFSEEDLYKKKGVDTLLKELKAKDLAYEKEGAWWFRAKDFGDTDDRVLVRATGEPTYFLPDLAYHYDKLAVRKFDEVVDIVGADHHGYAIRLGAALKALGFDLMRLRVIISQLVRLMKNGEEVKMSKRAGQFVLLEELIDEVGIDAARFFFLAQSPDTHMDFDMDLAKEQSNKNPVYYVQYSHARIASILKKAGKVAAKPKLGLLKSPEELALLKVLARFPEIIEETAQDYHVLRLTTYATDVARAFHYFYEKQRVISDDKALTAARLALVSGAQIVLKNTLDTMGISAPEKM